MIFLKKHYLQLFSFFLLQLAINSCSLIIYQSQINKVCVHILIYRRSRDTLNKYSIKLEELMTNKSSLEDEIRSNNKNIRKLNKEINHFYDQMYEHHKLVSQKDKQNELIDVYKKQKLDVANEHEAQELVLKTIINQYEKDKAESNAKNKEEINYKGCNIIIRKGDLTEEREDAIVNPANDQLNHAGGAAIAIASKGGEVIQKESKQYIKKHGCLPTGEAATTNAGDLPCEKVIHVVGPVYPRNNIRDQKQKEQLRNAIKSILCEMKKYNFNSVSFPAISTGVFRFPLELCAIIIGDVLKEAIDNDPEFYKNRRLIICNFDDKTTNKMLEYIPNCFIEPEEICGAKRTFITK